MSTWSASLEKGKNIMSVNWTEEQRAEYNERNKQKQKEIRRLAKEATRPICINIANASPELVQAIIKALEGK